MLTLKYQGKQRGPHYFFQIESSVNFLNKDLVIIAYHTSGALENFSHITPQRLASFKYVTGSIFSSFTQPKYTMLAASFSDSDAVDNLFQNKDITISLMRNVLHEDCIRGGAFVALAHFHAMVEYTKGQILSVDCKGVDADLSECKFDTLTFEQLGGIVRLPAKRTVRHQYDNLEKKAIKFKETELVPDDPFSFPIDVFETDVVLVELPAKVYK